MLLCLMIVKQSVLLLIVLKNIKLWEKNDMLAITLWRSVGKLSKQDLGRRPGLASGYSLQIPD